MKLNKQYTINGANQNTVAQPNIATFEKIEDVLENYALSQLMQDDDEILSLDVAQAYYAHLEQT